MFVYLDIFQNVIVYRPDLHNLQTRRQKFKRAASGCNEVSVNVKTKNAFKCDYFPNFLLCLKNA